MNEQLETTKALANATEAVANTTSKAIGAVESFGEFVSQFIHGSLEEGMGIVQDRLSFVRWERRVRLMIKVNEIMEQQNFKKLTKAIPLKIAIPIFTNATIEEEDFLQDRWAQMLVNASCNNVKVERSYISILEELSMIDVLNLEKIYELKLDNILNQSIDTDGLPEKLLISSDSPKPIPLISDEIEVSLQNLSRLGLIMGAFTSGGYYRYDCVYQTKLGRAFVSSCTLKK